VRAGEGVVRCGVAALCLAVVVGFPSPPATASDRGDLAPPIEWVTALSRDNDEIGYAVRLDGSGLHRLTAAERSIGGPDPSPDGTQAVFQRYREPYQIDLFAVDIPGGSPRLLIEDWWGQWAWSPDGSRLAIARGKNVDFLDPDTGTTERVLTVRDVRPPDSDDVFAVDSLGQIQWADSANRLAVEAIHAPDGVVINAETILLDADGGRIVRRGHSAAQLSPDGSTVAWEEIDTRRFLASSYNLDHRRMVEPGTDDREYWYGHWPLRWSRGGATAAWRMDGKLVVADLDGGPTAWSDRSGYVVGPWMDDRRVTTSAVEAGRYEIVDVDATGATRTYGTFGPEHGADFTGAYAYAVAADGRSVVAGVHHLNEGTGAQRQELWVAERGLVPRLLPAPREMSTNIHDVHVVSPRLGSTVRYAGVNRSDTAAQVSRAAFDSADTVVIARADAYPDALAGAPLAGVRNAPMLLTGRTALGPATAEEIRRLGPTTAYVLGTAGVVATEVEHELRRLGVADIRRIGGANRFDTAADVARTVGAPEGRAILVLGRGSTPDRGWADAVAGSAYAARTRTPVLLTSHETVPAATLDALRELEVHTVTIVGGPAAVSREVETELQSRGIAVERLAGADRYATSVAVAEHDRTTGGDGGRVWAVTGTNWPDALSAGPSAAAVGGLVVLMPAGPQGSSFGYIADRSPEEIVVVGGPQAVARTVQRQLAAALE
jgi:putative cell wall-binding protein